jgi:hypothetical protein
MRLACGKGVYFAFALKKHGVLADYAAEFLVRVGVYDEYATLLPNKVIVYVKGFVGFKFFKIFELQGK